MSQRSLWLPLNMLLALTLVVSGQAYSQIDSVGINTQTATCDKANGKMTVMGFGGVAPYTYSITGGTPVVTINNGTNNIFPGLTGGNYSVTVTDNAGHDTTVLAQVGDIKGPTIISMMATQGASCANNDGVVQIMLAQGTPKFSYWIGTDSLGDSSAQIGYARHVPSGTQTITVIDDNSCQATGSVSVPLDTNLTLAIDGGATICEGTSTTINVATNATAFSWSPATGLNSATVQQPIASPTTTTTYTLMATLGVCTKGGTSVITVLPAPVANAGPPVSTCYGKSVQLQGSGGVSYQWTPGTY